MLVSTATCNIQSNRHNYARRLIIDFYLNFPNEISNRRHICRCKEFNQLKFIDQIFFRKILRKEKFSLNRTFFLLIEFNALISIQNYNVNQSHYNFLYFSFDNRRFSNPQSSCSFISENYRSSCVQIYNYHRLLTWDQKLGLHMDIFKVPTCCSCHVHGYSEIFPPHQKDPPMKSKETFPGADFVTINDQKDDFQDLSKPGGLNHISKYTPSSNYDSSLGTLVLNYRFRRSPCWVILLNTLLPIPQGPAIRKRCWTWVPAGPASFCLIATGRRNPRRSRGLTTNCRNSTRPIRAPQATKGRWQWAIGPTDLTGRPSGESLPPTSRTTRRLPATSRSIIGESCFDVIYCLKLSWQDRCRFLSCGINLEIISRV